MSVLKIYNTAGATLLETVDNWDDIAQRLNSLGLRFERWKADQTLNDNCTEEEVLNAYKNDVQRLNQEYGFQSVDVSEFNFKSPR